MTENQLDSFHDNTFSKEDIDNLIRRVSTSFVQKYFIKEDISNQQYESDVFKIIKKLITEEIILIFGDSKKLQQEISTYIFKKYFKTIFKYISESLIEEVAHSNTNVIDFLKYYSLDTVVVDSKKYQVPQIKTDDGPRWNVVSIISVVKTYIKAKEHLSTLQSKLKDLDNELNFYSINGLSPLEYNERIKKLHDDLENSIKKNSLNIDILRDSISLEKDKKNLMKLTQELKDFAEQRLKLREEKMTLIKNKIKQRQINRYEKLNLELEAIIRDTKPYNIIVEQNKDKYLSIQNSLIKALISKAQAI